MVDAVLAASEISGKDFDTVCTTYTWRQIEMMAGYMLKKESLPSMMILHVIGSAFSSSADKSGNSSIKSKLPSGFKVPKGAKIIDLDSDPRKVMSDLASIGVLRRK